MNQGKHIDEALQELFVSKDADRSAELLGLITANRDHALEKLGALALGDSKPDAAYACWIIGKVGGGHPRAIALLRRVIDVPGRRIIGVRALGEQGSDAVEELLALARRGDAAGDESLDVVLLKFPERGGDVLEAVRERLRGGAAEPYHPLVVLGRLDYKGEDLVDICESYLDHPSPTVRRGALSLIVRQVSGQTAQIHAARTLLDDADNRVRMYAAFVLARLGHGVPENVGRIADCLSSTEENTVLWSLEYLQALGEAASSALPRVRGLAMPQSERVKTKWKLAIERLS